MKSSLIIIIIFCATALSAAQIHNNSVVLPLTAAPQLLIPIAGSTPGANGTFFRSDIAMFNFASHDQMVKLRWLPGSGGTSATSTIAIKAQSGIRSADFVASILGQSGLGSILVTGVNSDGTADVTARLYVSSRVWTREPGTDGTTSQSLPAIPTSAVNMQAAALFAAGGADNPANYRVNVGIVNLDPNNMQTFVVSLPTTSGSTSLFIVTVPAMSMQHIGLGSGVSSTQQINIQNVTGGTAQSNSWIAYGSTVDNITGDAWSELALAGQPQS